LLPSVHLARALFMLCCAARLFGYTICSILRAWQQVQLDRRQAWRTGGYTAYRRFVDTSTRTIGTHRTLEGNRGLIASNTAPEWRWGPQNQPRRAVRASCTCRPRDRITKWSDQIIELILNANRLLSPVWTELRSKLNYRGPNYRGQTLLRAAVWHAGLNTEQQQPQAVVGEGQQMLCELCHITYCLFCSQQLGVPVREHARRSCGAVIKERTQLGHGRSAARKRLEAEKRYGLFIFFLGVFSCLSVHGRQRSVHFFLQFHTCSVHAMQAVINRAVVPAEWFRCYLVHVLFVLGLLPYF
jgi:hypothetical protein